MMLPADLMYWGSWEELRAILQKDVRFDFSLPENVAISNFSLCK